MEVSLWDIERTFAASAGGESQMNGKRKKELEEGETWRAKNVSLPNVMPPASSDTMNVTVIGGPTLTCVDPT